MEKLKAGTTLGSRAYGEILFAIDSDGEELYWLVAEREDVKTLFCISNKSNIRIGTVSEEYTFHGYLLYSLGIHNSLFNYLGPALRKSQENVNDS